MALSLITNYKPQAPHFTSDLRLANNLIEFCFGFERQRDSPDTHSDPIHQLYPWALRHQSSMKELAATKTNCCITSHCLCFGQKVALEHTLERLQLMAH